MSRTSVFWKHCKQSFNKKHIRKHIMTDNTDWEMDLFREGDQADILALNQIEYGDTALSQAPYLEWILRKNPMAPPIIPVARECSSGKVIGFAMMTPVRLHWRETETAIVLGYNLVVSRQHRRQGIFMAIREHCIQRCLERGYHLLYTFPNERSRQGHIKQGDLVVSETPLVVRPLDIESLTKTAIQNSLLRWGVNTAWKLAAQTIYPHRRPPRSDLAIEIVQESHPGVEFDDFWQRVKGKHELMLVRDSKYLQYRYVDIACREYQIFSARHQGEIWGYVILRQAPVRGIQVGLIADFMVLPGAQGDLAGRHLLHHALANFSKANLQLTGGLMMPHTQEFAILKQAGYLISPQRFAPQKFHLTVISFDGYFPDETLLKVDNWFLTAADHDAI
jgi:GNAT superfamily N-acetyltransferase